MKIGQKGLSTAAIVGIVVTVVVAAVVGGVVAVLLLKPAPMTPGATTTTTLGGTTTTMTPGATTTTTTTTTTLTPSFTNLSLSPSTFTLLSGASTTLISTLTSNGNPLANKLLEFSASVGDINPSAGVTDSNGHVSITYTASTVDVQTSVTITASFTGDTGYRASSTSSLGTIKPKPTVKLTAEVTVPYSYSSTLLYSLSQEILNSIGTPLATVNLSNRGNATAKDVSVKVKVSGYGDYYSVSVSDIAGGSSTQVKITPRADSEIMNLTSDTQCEVEIVVGYLDTDGVSRTIEISKGILITEINSFSWFPPEWVSAWVTPTNVSVRAFATEATRELGATNTDDTQALTTAKRIFNEIGAYGVRYITDAHTSGDYVQFSVQTLKNKSGDCEDLAILYSSLLESVGVNTRLVLVPGHMFAVIVLPSGTYKPIETTMVGGDFDSATSYGASEYQSHLEAGDITEINPILEHELGVGPADITMSAPIPNINVSISDPTYWWDLGRARAKVTVTFTNNGDASGIRGIEIYAIDSGYLTGLVGENSQYYLDLTQEMAANTSWTRDVVFAPGGAWFPSHIDEIEVHYSIIQ